MLLVHGPESKIIPPRGIFVDPNLFVVWALAFKNLLLDGKSTLGVVTLNLFPWQPVRFLMKDCNALRSHILAIYVFKTTLLVSKY